MSFSSLFLIDWRLCTHAERQRAPRVPRKISPRQQISESLRHGQRPKVMRQALFALSNQSFPLATATSGETSVVGIHPSLSPFVGMPLFVVIYFEVGGGVSGWVVAAAAKRVHGCGRHWRPSIRAPCPSPSNAGRRGPRNDNEVLGRRSSAGRPSGGSCGARSCALGGRLWASGPVSREAGPKRAARALLSELGCGHCQSRATFRLADSDLGFE